MAGNSVRGLTVEIAADTKGFKKGMDTMRNDAKSAQKDLASLQKQLKLDYNADKLKEAQKVAQEALDKTTRNADTLRERLHYLEDAGKVDTHEYQKLKDELNKTDTKALELKKTLEQLNQVKIDKLKENLDKAANTMKGVSAAAAAVVGGLTASALSAVSTADQIATLAVKYDTTAEAIQRMNYVALQTDTAADDMYKGLVKIRTAISDIETGSVNASSEALKSLGLSLDSIGGTEEQFYTIISALSQMEDQTLMVSIANDIFGERLANNLLPIIRAGGGAIETYVGEFSELGALTNDQTKKFAELDNVLNKIKTQLANVATQVWSDLFPLIESFTNFLSEKLIPKIREVTGSFGGLSAEQQKMAAGALLVAAAAAPLFAVLSKVVSIAGTIMNIIPKISSALSLLAAHPIIAAIAAVAGLMAVLYNRSAEFKAQIDEIAGTLGGTLFTALKSITNTVGIVFNAISPLLNTALDLATAFLSDILIPIQAHLSMLQIPLGLLGQALEWLTPLFKTFGDMVSGVMNTAVGAINVVLGAVETSINWIINKVNVLIDGINTALGALGVKLERVGNVSLKIKMTTESTNKSSSTTNNTQNSKYDDFVFDNKEYTYNGDVYNYDYSQKTTTQNVTVTIENYASDVDVDDLVRKINVKLAEEM